MQTKCRFYTRAKNDAVPGGTFEKGPSKGVTNLCFFWKVATPKTQKRATEWQQRSGGVGRDPSRKYQLQHNYVWRTMRERSQREWMKKRKRKRGRARVGELCMTAMIDLWKEHTPKGYWKALNFWHGQTLRRERGRRSRRIQSKGKFFSYVIV